MLPTHQPHHPGEFIRQDILEEFAMTEQQLVEKLDFPVTQLNQVLIGQQQLSADLAWRLGKLTKTTPELWMNLQIQLDLWQAYQRNEKDLQRISSI